jgi:hypothetical protein
LVRVRLQDVDLDHCQVRVVMAELHCLRQRYSILDMPEALIDECDSPPRNPDECIFARTTATVSADLKPPITPCEFGGDPDCEQCGCFASMGLAAVGDHRVFGPLKAGHLFRTSDRLGRAWRRWNLRSPTDQRASATGGSFSSRGDTAFP